MSAMNDGGPAFPVPVKDATDGRTHDCGLSIRDWFAGQALVGLMAQPDQRVCPKDRMSDVASWKSEQYMEDAKTCYAYADAMLAARGAK